jgi:hypothetical protein
MSDPCQFICEEIDGGTTVCAFPAIAGTGPNARCEKHYQHYMLALLHADNLEMITLLQAILAKP